MMRNMVAHVSLSFAPYFLSDITTNTRRRNMANITVVLREEISRLARKEIKNQTTALGKT